MHESELIYHYSPVTCISTFNYTCKVLNTVSDNIEKFINVIINIPCLKKILLHSRNSHHIILLLKKFQCCSTRGQIKYGILSFLETYILRPT